MSLFRRALGGITGSAPPRPPVGNSYSGLNLALGGPARTLSALNTMGASGWLFACIDRIAASVSSIEWKLYQRRSDGDLEAIVKHPLLDLWGRPNPFYTNQELVEVSSQHFELTGEMWWVLLRNRAGIPVEMWPIRPDRISPVPNRDQYIAGYEYRVGAEAIPLKIEDVIFIRRPSPVDAYRGIGVVGSILSTIATEREASEWTAQFFRNNAEPGGIIQFDEELDDASFDRIVQRWRAQHQGTQNAHRVAVIERGKWVDRAYTNRDIQLEQLRRLDRDLILGAFGMPASVLGIAEDVNRANAEAAQFTLSQNILLPRLRRIQGEINLTLAPMFGPDLVLMFTDPTPENREHDLLEATQGYRSGFLTKNEARKRLREAPVEEGGDEFFVAPPGSPSFLNFPTGLGKALRGDDPPLLTEGQESQESRITKGWTRRLKREAENIVVYLDRFKALSATRAAARQKLELSDLLGADFDWWARYGDEVIMELSAAYRIALTDADPSMTPSEVQRRASLYANERGARLLRLDGDMNMAEATRARVNAIVGEALARGDGLQAIQKQLREDFAFSRERAAMVARTESATALGQGAKEVAFSQGRDEKRWVTQGFGSDVDQVCLDNEAQGWIPIEDVFSGGVDTIPQHPSCRCVVRYRTAVLHEESFAVRAESRCPKCDRLLGFSIMEGELRCPRCKSLVRFRAGKAQVIPPGDLTSPGGRV